MRDLRRRLVGQIHVLQALVSTCRSRATKMALNSRNLRWSQLSLARAGDAVKLMLSLFKKDGSLFETSSCVLPTKLFLSLNHSWLEERSNLFEDVERVELCSTPNKPSNGNTSY